MITTDGPSTGTARDVPGDVHVVSPAPRDAWRSALRADPTALPTQTPEWTDWLCRTRGFSDASRLYEFHDGRRLLLPLVARTVAGVRVSEDSLPGGLGYGGPLVPDGLPSPRERQAVLADLSQRGAVRTSLTSDPRTAAIWEKSAPADAIKVPYLAHVLDLEGGFDDVWSKRFRSGMRRDVRLAEKQGLEIRTGKDSDVVAVFAELNRRSVDRWAHQRGQPLWLARLVERRRNRVDQLATAVTELGEMVQGWTAHLRGEPVAVNVVLRFGNQAHGWMNAMDRDLSRQTQAGALLMSLVIEDACRSGARWFQLGESDPGSGVGAFKERFGATPVSYSALRFERLPVTATERSARALLDRIAAARNRRTAGVRR
jgi:CelD/BcsL family acetyltransferase involved in cellulose biosynthesis